MKFEAGTEILRKVEHDDLKEYHQQGRPFAGGDKFPLLRGRITKPINEDYWNYMYAVEEDGEA